MTARRGAGVAGIAAAAAVAVALTTSGRIETAGASKQSVARERPRGVVLDCSTISGIGGRREFWSRWNLVIEPLALKGAAARPAYYAESFRGNKFPALVRGGHRVTLEVAPEARPGAGLVYGQIPANRRRLRRDGYRVVTFVACRRGEITGDIVDGWPVSGWSGGVRASSPRCVPLLVWVDDETSPRRAVIHLGVTDCA